MQRTREGKKRKKNGGPAAYSERVRIHPAGKMLAPLLKGIGKSFEGRERGNDPLVNEQGHFGGRNRTEKRHTMMSFSGLVGNPKTLQCSQKGSKKWGTDSLVRCAV